MNDMLKVRFQAIVIPVFILNINVAIIIQIRVDNSQICFPFADKNEV